MKKRLPVLSILCAGSLWGTIGIFVRKISGYGIGSMEITFFRALVTAACMVLFLLLTDRKKLRVRFRDLWCFAGTGLCSIVFFNFCYFQTILLTSLSTAAILLYTAPFVVTVLSAALFREKITVKKAAALVLAFGGCALVAGAPGGAGAALSGPALLFGLGAGFGYALYSIFGRYGLMRYGFLTVTAYTFVFASFGCLPFIRLPALFQTLGKAPESLVPLLLMGILTSTVPYTLYTLGLKYVESGRASIIASVEPVVASLTGIFFYREPLTFSAALGAGLVLFSVLLLNICPSARVKTLKIE